MKPNLFFCLLLLSIGSFSQEQLSVKEQKEDFDVLRGSLEDFHPGLYWYNSKKKTDSLFEAACASINQTSSSSIFLTKAAKVISEIGCGHTTIRPPSNEKRKLLPIKLKFIGSKAFYLKSWTKDSLDLDPAAEILSINNKTIHDIISESLNYLSSDGNRPYLKYFLLNNYFQYVYADYFESPDYFTIAYRSDDEVLRTLVKGLTYLEIVENAQIQKYTKPDPRNLTLENIDSISTAVLTVKRFADWKEGGKNVGYESKLKSIFHSISETEVGNLIIDLRGNGGGKMPWELYSYFIDSTFIFAKRTDFILTKDSRYYSYQKLHPYMKFLKRKWLHSWLLGSNKISKLNDSTWTLHKHEMVRPQKPSTPRFKGNVYILIDGGTSSAASLFAAKMRSNTDAIFIGEETGGGYYGNTAMEKSYVTLPNSKLRLEIPLVRFQLNVEDIYPLGSGVKPDHHVTSNLQDILNDIDTEMIFTLNLVN